MMRLRSWWLVPSVSLLALTGACSSENTMALDGGTAAVDADTKGDGGSDSDAGSADAGPEDTGTIAVGMVELSGDTVDLGKVVLTSTATAKLTIRNPGSEAVQVSLSQPSGNQSDRFTRTISETQSSEGVFILEAGKSTEVTITVAPKELGNLVASLAIDSCAGTCPSAILLVGEGVETGIECDTQIDFGLVNPGQCSTSTVACINQGNLQEELTDATLSMGSDPSFTVEVTSTFPQALNPMDQGGFTTRYCPTAIGSHQGSLEISSKGAFEVKHPIRLLGQGGGADIRCSPAEVDFGIIGINVAATSAVTCINLGVDPGMVEATLSNTPDFNLTSMGAMQISPGSSAVFNLEAFAMSVGMKQASLEIKTNDPDTPTISIAIRADAQMVVPCNATIEPATIEFGLVSLGDLRTIPVDISNTGNSPCTLDRVRLSSAATGVFRIAGVPPTGTNIPAGEAVRLQLSMAPRRAMAETGNLEVTFSNPGSQVLTAAITGEGGNLGLGVEPSAVDFGTVATGCSEPATQVVTLRQLGQGTGVVSRVQLTNNATGAFSLAGVGQLPNRLDNWETLSFQVSFNPPAPGNYSAQLRVFTGGSNPPIIIPIVGRSGAQASRTDSFRLAPKQVDVLMVMDDSCSMGEAQAAASAAVPGLITQLRARNANVHLGVVTTDVDDAALAGVLRGNPNYLTLSSANLERELAARLSPGTQGSGREQGIAAATTAVTPPVSSGTNSGFLRTAADLAIVVVSDEDDFSPADIGIASRVAAIRAAAGAGTLTINGITGAADEDCEGPYGDATEAPRYAEFVTRGSGVMASFCQPIANSLNGVFEHILGSTRFELSAEPVISTITVTVNGTAVPAQSGSTSTWAYDLSNNQVVFLDLSALPSTANVEITYDSFCLLGSCGDSMQDPGEQCDDGNMSDTDSCIACISAICGDGFVLSGTEQCDDGNLDQTDNCLMNCQEASCGDGFVQAGVEDCDDGNTMNGDSCPATCRFYSSSGPTGAQFSRLQTGQVLQFRGGQNPDSEGFAQVTMPFSFNYFGTQTSTLTISPNGVIFLGNVARADHWNNASIPDTAAPSGGIIAPWWDNLVVDRNIQGGASVAVETLGMAPNRTYIIQWRDVRSAAHSTRNHRRWTFQVQIDEGTDVVRFHYAETETSRFVPTAVEASVGIENSDGSRGLEPLGCSPACDGRETGRGDFPENSVITFTP